MKLAVPPDKGLSKLQAKVVEAKTSTTRFLISSGVDTDILFLVDGVGMGNESRWRC